MVNLEKYWRYALEHGVELVSSGWKPAESSRHALAYENVKRALANGCDFKSVGDDIGQLFGHYVKHTSRWQHKKRRLRGPAGHLFMSELQDTVRESLCGFPTIANTRHVIARDRTLAAITTVTPFPGFADDLLQIAGHVWKHDGFASRKLIAQAAPTRFLGVW